MKVVVRLFAQLRERAGRNEIALENLPDALDVGALKREIERRHPGLGSLAQVRGAVGTEYVAETRRLAEGETLALIPPVSGGTSERELEHGVFELRAGALDAEEAQDLVRDAHYGAIATFIGTTRAMSRGREVVRLEYEAFDAMTGAEMARIFERCRTHVATSPERTLRMLVHHRIGTVEVGEPSVVIAVASPHRDAAFTACRFLIDELKQSMPIWKKEIYADGEEWIGERS
ncbi:MAG TPA: molybdenum cofactor biosynthesis protein MoaE [Planctomycetota bacterium]|jgi:molybdopterin synthase catalytic subunit|nr:molybdenum cofactor biosynthesis protein MoaE [Planctomycetota bacterium]